MLEDFYRIPNIDQYADLHLSDLGENCARLEEKVYEIAWSLPDKQRQILESYILTRNDLEFETFKAALRWGKQYYK